MGKTHSYEIQETALRERRSFVTWCIFPKRPHETLKMFAVFLFRPRMFHSDHNSGFNIHTFQPPWLKEDYFLRVSAKVTGIKSAIRLACFREDAAGFIQVSPVGKQCREGRGTCATLYLCGLIPLASLVICTDPGDDI